MDLYTKKWSTKDFYKELFDFCFPADFRLRQRAKLERFRQNQKRVRDYAAELAMIFRTVGSTSEQEKVDHLWKGLRPELQRALWRENLDPRTSTWEEIIQVAERHEIADRIEIGDRHAGSRSSGKEKKRRSSSSASDNDSGSSDSDNRSSDTSGDSKSRRRLSEKEKSELKAQGRCFTCKEKGHLSRDCPQRGSTSVNEETSGAKSFNIEVAASKEKALSESEGTNVDAVESSFVGLECTAISLDCLEGESDLFFGSVDFGLEVLSDIGQADEPEIDVHSVEDVPRMGMFTETTGSKISGIIFEENDLEEISIIARHEAELSPDQNEYAMHDLELLAGIETILKFDDLLQNRPFRWLTDYKGLAELINCKNLSERQAGLLTKISTCDFKIGYDPAIRDKLVVSGNNIILEGESIKFISSNPVERERTKDELVYDFCRRFGFEVLTWYADDVVLRGVRERTEGEGKEGKLLNQPEDFIVIDLKGFEKHDFKFSMSIRDGLPNFSTPTKDGLAMALAKTSEFKQAPNILGIRSRRNLETIIRGLEIVNLPKNLTDIGQNSALVIGKKLIGFNTDSVSDAEVVGNCNIAVGTSDSVLPQEDLRLNEALDIETGFEVIELSETETVFIPKHLLSRVLSNPQLLYDLIDIYSNTSALLNPGASTP
ncbi:hypothetical protein CVT26_005641, partial [Gymnopilus dilepis]